MDCMGLRAEPYRCRANMAHVKQSMPDHGLACQVKVLTTFRGVSSSLESSDATVPHQCMAAEEKVSSFLLSSRVDWGDAQAAWDKPY